MLLPKLMQAGHEVIGMSYIPDCTPLIRASGAKAIVVDAFDREALCSTLVDIQPDVVIHQLTSLSNWNIEDNAWIRIKGTRDFCQRLLFVYGISVRGNTGHRFGRLRLYGRPQAEPDLRRGVFPYDGTYCLMRFPNDSRAILAS